MQIHNYPEFSIDFFENSSILKFVWKDKPITVAKFKDLVLLYADEAKKYKVKNLYIDAICNSVTMTKEVQDWHDTVIVKKYVDAGVKKMGFLVPKNIFSEMTHKQTFEKENAKGALQINFFGQEDAALEWFNKK